MSERRRSFFAIELPPEVRAAVVGAVDAMREALSAPVRWLPEENLHLTLKFLGEIREDAIPKLLARAASRLLVERPFQVELAGPGAFPNARSARVLWLGVGAGSGELARLARKLEAAGRAVGGERDRSPFRAHLTVGRLPEPRAVAIERLPAPDSPGFSVEEVVLYESRLSSSGATYSPLARLPLGADGDAIELAPEL